VDIVLKIPTARLIAPIPTLDALASSNNTCEPILAVPAMVERIIVGRVM
jgi:hypothetical protein